MKKLVRVVSSFVIAMVVTCGMVCAVASADIYTTGKYAYMSGIVEPSNKGIVAVKNISSATRHVKITSTVLGNNSGAVKSGEWLRQSKENSGPFSATAVIRKNSSSTSTILETLKLN